MCGIGAIINGKTERITEMMSPIRARGEPESFNEYEVIGNTVISCNRLKIVGRETGKQPVHNEDKTIFAIFNGEIYNYEQLKRELEEKGHIFSTKTDTEILVHGFEEWGNNLSKFLDGQFAFVVYDKKNRKYLAVRDHFGIKPLFWAKENETVYFASELKQLVGFVKDIKEVLPSHFIADEKVERYYALKSKENNDDVENAKVKIRTLFDEAVKKRVNTDLPIAVFLSGGIDSTAVLATAKKYHNKVAAIVVGNYWESEDSDYKAAMKYCKENDIPVIARNPPTEQELFELIPEIVKVTESFEPNMIKQSGLSLFLSKIAKEHGFKVVLCGEGADEVFCGYPEFTKITKDKIKELSFDFFNNLYRTQLQRVDRTSMSHTIEVRVPFMDKTLVEYAINLTPELKINGKTTKWILRKAMEDRLPKYISERKKVVLSEGMGLKGNSLKDGLFTQKISNLLSRKELEKVKKEFSNFLLLNSEDAYYFKIYNKLGYSKLEFNGRTIVNKTHSTISKEDILEIINKKRFRRDIPYKIDEVFKLSIIENKPIKMVGFWGIGTKGDPDKIDLEAIKHLQNLMKQVKDIFEPGLEFTFIIADKHGEMNGVPKELAEKYADSISKILLKNRFKVIWLSSLWEKYNISREKIKEELSKKSSEWWKRIENKELLLENASKFNHNKKPQDAVKFYLVMRELEKSMLEKEFNDYIFQTYSDSKMQMVLPNMSKIYMYARKGWSNAPWFCKEKELPHK